MQKENSGAVCNAIDYSPWIGFKVGVPPSHLEEALKNPDAIQLALQLGRLDIVSLLLAFMGLLAGLAAVVAYLEVRHRAASAARDAAKLAAAELLKTDGVSLLRECIRDPEVVAALQSQLNELGLEDAEDASAEFFAIEGNGDQINDGDGKN